jgi:hypothetical protein
MTTPLESAPAAPIAPEQQPDARRFLGMQLRRGRRADGEPQPDILPPAPPRAPLAAWPTDLGGAVVAHAEPATPFAPPLAPWGGPVPPGAVTDAAPAPALEIAPAPAAPAPAPAEAAAEAPVVAPVEAPVVAPVVALAPVPAPQPSAADDQVRALKALLQTSEAQRAAADNRADQAVAYAQQTQAEVHQREAAFAAQVQALEARARTLANEAQDWQIRHREAEAQVTELAQSVASAEARLAEVRSERDDLLAALEEATSPEGATVRDEQPAEQA